MSFSCDRVNCGFAIIFVAIYSIVFMVQRCALSFKLFFSMLSKVFMSSTNFSVFLKNTSLLIEYSKTEFKDLKTNPVHRNNHKYSHQ
jgi:hypothetical protein